MDAFIYETVVYCGRTKIWRVLNLNTMSIYSMDYETEQEAIDSIEDGKQRSDKTVKYIDLFAVRDCVTFTVTFSDKSLDLKKNLYKTIV